MTHPNAAGESLLELADKAAHGSTPEARLAFMTALATATVDEIAVALSGMGGLGRTGAIEGCREAARATLEAKLSDRAIRATRRLECVGLFVGAAGLVLAAAQVWLALRSGCP